MCISVVTLPDMAESLPPSYESAVGSSPLHGFKDFWPKCLNKASKAKNGAFEDFM